MAQRQHYFAAGPAALPDSVKQQIQLDIAEYGNSGLSILELGHRSPEFAIIIEQARQLLRSLYAIPDHFEILFMQAGATAQFDAIPLNLLSNKSLMTYVDSGHWSRRAAEFAEKYGCVQRLSAVSEAKSVDADVMPSERADWQITADSAYIHMTPNETIEGIQIADISDANVPVVADMTSCLLMRAIDFERYDLVYAGAQKTLGIAGVTLVIVRQDLLQQATEQTPYMLRYDIHAEQQSIVNTSPVFAVNCVLRMLQWLKAQGGLAPMLAAANERSSLLYKAIDEQPLTSNKVSSELRSSINVCFDIAGEKRLQQFLAEAEMQGLLGLAGHRHHGGVRASMYNGTTLSAVESLAEMITAL